MKSGLFKKFQTDKGKEVDGIWFEYDVATNDDETVPAFLVARAGKGNKSYQKALEKEFKPYRQQQALGLLTNETAEKVTQRAFIQGCLKSWRNIQDENGEEIPFSIENASKLFTDLPELYAHLNDQAGELANYRREGLQDDSGN